MWSAVVGQPQAISKLAFAAADPVHAYLFVGPSGSTKAEASRAFAALLMAGTDDPLQRDARLALAGQHPDVREVERQGARISAEQVADIIRNASLAPVEGNRKVMILHDFHLLDAAAAARLLKTLEEPPPSTIFIVLADQVTPELVTIASRCVRILFAALSNDAVAAELDRVRDRPRHCRDRRAGRRGQPHPGPSAGHRPRPDGPPRRVRRAGRAVSTERVRPS